MKKISLGIMLGFAVFLCIAAGSIYDTLTTVNGNCSQVVNFTRQVSLYGQDLQAMLDGKEASGTASSAISTHNSSGSSHSDIRSALSAKLSDAPSDGNQYCRKDAAWSIITAGLSDAPSDGSLYGRQNGAWSAISTGSSPAWGAITGTLSSQTDLQSALDAKASNSSLATVATSGNYSDLANKPTIPAAQVNSDWSASSGLAQILNKPTLGTAAALDVGTTANKVVQLDSSGKLPAIDGSQLTGISGGGSMPVIQPDISLCQGRLTLESGVAVSTTDQTAKTTLYWTPYNGNQVALYNGSAWILRSFTETSLSLSGYTADTNYDIWGYDNAGTLALDSDAWTNATTRATALALQNGVYVKSGDTTRRYLGTIRTTAIAGQTEDSATKRFVWNYYNRTGKALQRYSTLDHTYSTVAWRYVNADSTMKIEFVSGFPDLLDCVVASQLGGGAGLAVGINTTAASHVCAYNSYANLCAGSRTLFIPINGYAYISLLELGATTPARIFDAYLNAIINN